MISKNKDFDKILPELKFHFNNIYRENNYKFQKCCGSYLFDGLSYEYDAYNEKKQKLLYSAVKDCSNVLEIGVYMGHSILIMLLANPKLNITCVDIDGTYAIPSINYLKKQFPEANINLSINNSLTLLKKSDQQFDFFHIDGDHTMRVILKELFVIFNKNKLPKLKLLFDDVDCMNPIKKCILKTFDCKYIQPQCKNANIYFNISINKNIFETQLLNFKKEVKKIYKNILIQDLKVITNKILLKIYFIIFHSNSFGKRIRKILKQNTVYKYILLKINNLLNTHNT